MSGTVSGSVVWGSCARLSGAAGLSEDLVRKRATRRPAAKPRTKLVTQ